MIFKTNFTVVYIFVLLSNQKVEGKIDFLHLPCPVPGKTKA